MDITSSLNYIYYPCLRHMLNSEQPHWIIFSHSMQFIKMQFRFFTSCADSLTYACQLRPCDSTYDRSTWADFPEKRTFEIIDSCADNAFTTITFTVKSREILQHYRNVIVHAVLVVLCSVKEKNIVEPLNRRIRIVWIVFQLAAFSIVSFTWWHWSDVMRRKCFHDGCHSDEREMKDNYPRRISVLRWVSSLIYVRKNEHSSSSCIEKWNQRRNWISLPALSASSYHDSMIF